MERIVEEEELYLDPDLMLESLAKRLSTQTVLFEQLSYECS